MVILLCKRRGENGWVPASVFRPELDQIGCPLAGYIYRPCGNASTPHPSTSRSRLPITMVRTRSYFLAVGPWAAGPRRKPPKALPSALRIGGRGTELRRGISDHKTTWQSRQRVDSMGIRTSATGLSTNDWIRVENAERRRPRLLARR